MVGGYWHSSIMSTQAKTLNKQVTEAVMISEREGSPREEKCQEGERGRLEGASEEERVEEEASSGGDGGSRGGSYEL